MKRYLIVTKYIRPGSELIDQLDHENTLKSVKEVLKHKGHKFKVIPVNKVKLSHINKHDGVITVGGDGTVLHVAKYLIEAKYVQFFTINSQPNKSVGYLTKFTRKTFIDTFMDSAAFDTVYVYPIKVRGRKPIGHFTNDVLFSNKNPAAVSKYTIQIDDELRETQTSSGVWIASRIGSTAAIKSAGFELPLPLENKGNTMFTTNTILYKVREPYEMKSKYLNKEGALHGKFIKLVALVPGMCLWLDGSYDRYELKVGEQVIIHGTGTWGDKYNMVIPKRIK